MHSGLIASSSSSYPTKYLIDFFVQFGSWFFFESNVLLTSVSYILITFFIFLKITFFRFFVAKNHVLSTHSYTS